MDNMKVAPTHTQPLDTRKKGVHPPYSQVGIPKQPPTLTRGEARVREGQKHAVCKAPRTSLAEERSAKLRELPSKGKVMT